MLLDGNKYKVTNTGYKIKRMKSFQQIDSLAKIILNRCKKEKDYKHLKVPLNENELRVAYYTGLPGSLMYQLQCVEYINDCFDTLSSDDSLGNSDHIAIMICLRDMYMQKALPKMQNLYEAIHASRIQNDKKYTASYDEFCYEASLLGYHYRALRNGDFMIMEDPKLTFERCHYLKKLQSKSNAKRYYLDERTIGKNFCTKKSALVKEDYDKDILLLAISRDGCEKGMYGKKTLVHEYINWITETLLQDLEPSSVVIINPHHGQSKNKTITKYHSKKDMLTWLKNHNIPCSDEMHKAELYELIDKSSLNSPQSIVKNILKANGHTVLILPLSLQNFTPTELLWRDLQSKSQKSEINATKLSASEICACIETVSKNQWSLYEDTIKNQENIIYDIDLGVDEALEYYVLDPI